MSNSATGAYWPEHLARRFVLPETTLARNLEISALRYPEMPAIHFFGSTLTYKDFLEQVNALAGWLQQKAGLGRGERVLLFMQNAPQWLIAYYAVLRADAVAVPVNPMNRAAELDHFIRDSGASVAFCTQELVQHLLDAPSAGELRQVVTSAYSDYLPEAPVFKLPDWLREPLRAVDGTTAWREALAAGHAPRAPEAGPDDLCALHYTSGSTGLAKGCMHTHRTFMHTAMGISFWHRHVPGTVFLGVSPMYQIAGLLNNVNCSVYSAATVVPMPRWDRDLAVQLIDRYRVNWAGLAPTAVIDLLSKPDLDRYDLTSLRRVSAGGAPMPQEVWRRMHDTLGLPFIEAYGMTEAAGTTHINPIERPKPQCLGVAFFDTESFAIDLETGRPLGPNAQGELVMRGPQFFKGYWNLPEATREAFIEIDGKQYYRSGDIGYVDEEGYFFMTDRLKRMINASGFKVWPAQVETRLYEHEAIREACVVSSPDRYRGETVKALVVLQPEQVGSVTEQQIIDWAKARLPAYKYPRQVEFIDALPKAPTGKILWRELQDRENARASEKRGDQQT
ncbi:MAG: long-chain-fatty-acid--CoA ligase [Aquisalimonadaceae bacterium]